MNSNLKLSLETSGENNKCNINLKDLIMKTMFDFTLPKELRILFAEKVDIGEKTTNDVYFCKGEFKGHPIDFYLKVNESPPSGLTNEKNVLEALASTSIPTPRILWFGGGEKEILALEAIKGYLLWDFIDPKRKKYDSRKVLPYLNTYGRSLAKLHNLKLKWAPQKRSRLYNFIGEQDLNEDRFTSLIAWLRNKEPIQKIMIFVHGDYNTASVIFDHDKISGIIDWEFAGLGWKEYDLAWILRARLDFLNTDAERQAIIDGYKQHSIYDEETLRWCEVLNYLHFAYWDRNDYPLYTKFAIQKAQELIR